MKSIKIITRVVVMILGISSLAGAAVVSDPFAGFWVYDNLSTGCRDGHVDTSSVTAGPDNLKNCTGNGPWNSIGPGINLNTIHIETGTSNNQLIQFHFIPGTQTLTSATLTFLGFDTNSAILNFGVHSEYVLGPSGDDDHVGSAPQTPVPATVWLLGSGIIGLIGIKRRIDVY